MSGWREQYLASVQELQRNSPANAVLVETCSQLQDRVAALLAERETLVPPPNAADQADAAGKDAAGKDTADDPQQARLRLELAETLRSQGQLQTRLKAAEDELETLRGRSRGDTKAIRVLTGERNALVTKVRDRDEELRGKSKLVEHVQDELIALTLQLNMAEQQRNKVQAENKHLLERWLKWKGEEADAMNRANEPASAQSPR